MLEISAVDEAPVEMATDDATAADVDDRRPEDPIQADDLIEEISIDGMCGVY